RIDAGEGRTTEVDAGIDDTDHDALALRATRRSGVAALPYGGRADQGRTEVGVEPVFAIRFDQADAGQILDAGCLRRGQFERDRVDGVLQALLDAQGVTDLLADGRFMALLRAIEEAEIGQCLGTLQVRAVAVPALHRRRRRRHPGYAAAITGQRGLREHH